MRRSTGPLGLRLTLREELIPKGIRVMALMPGATDTEIWKQFWPDAPRDKMIEPDSVAEAVLYAVLFRPTPISGTADRSSRGGLVVSTGQLTPGTHH